MKFAWVTVACLFLAGCAGGAGGGWPLAVLSLCGLLVGCYSDSKRETGASAPPAATSPEQPEQSAESLAGDTVQARTANTASTEAGAEAEATHELNPSAQPAPWDGARFSADALLGTPSNTESPTRGSLGQSLQEDPFRPVARSAVPWNDRQVALTPQAREYLEERYGPEPHGQQEIEARIHALEEVVNYPLGRVAPIYEEAELTRLRERLTRVQLVRPKRANP